MRTSQRKVNHCQESLLTRLPPDNIPQTRRAGFSKLLVREQVNMLE